ncbi:hypothetical protein ACTPEF_24500, partial [Clostridioides difficile]
REVAFSIESQEKVFMNQKAKEIFETMNQLKGTNSCINKQHIQPLVGVKLGFPVIIESIVPIIISAFIIYSAYGIFRPSIGILVD